VLLPPEINLGTDTVLCVGKSMEFSGYGNGDFLWQDNSTSDYMNVTKAGLYFVNLSNQCGTATDSCLVNYSDCDQLIWIPNAFTPNGDGNNEVFLPYIENVDLYRFMIFNRWGELIFETKDKYLGWDGTFNGDRSPGGAYGWRIDYTNSQGESFCKYGYVILYR
jgi:gliding motility-associated-like protein